jgi:site-specific DNA recombinase
MLLDALGRDILYLDPADKAGFRNFNPKRVCVEPHEPAKTRRATS